jgi:hypothetical protein
MTETAAARMRLFSALVAALPADEISVELTRPLELAVPLVYIDVAGRRFDVVDGAPVVVATLPVVIVVDGSDDEQVYALDDYGDRVWKAALDAAMTPTQASPAQIAAGGPVLRGVVTAIDVDLDHLTLCPDPEE